MYFTMKMYKFIARKILLKLDSLNDSITDTSFKDLELSTFFVHLLLFD